MKSSHESRPVTFHRHQPSPVTVAHHSKMVATIFLLCGLCAMDARADQVAVHVDHESGSVDPSGPEPGGSWTNAYKYLQDGLARASDLDPSPQNIIVVRVRGRLASEGGLTYYPDEGDGLTLGDRTYRFELRDHVSIMGGFVGTGSNPDERDPATYITILSGDLDEDDQFSIVDGQPVFVNDDENSHNIVRAVEVGRSAVIDGFTIRGGNSGVGGSGGGAGIRSLIASPTIRNCRIIGNRTVAYGGGIHLNHPFGSELPEIRNCEIIGNFADVHGGGMNVTEGAAVINCAFEHNVAESGGAVHWNEPEVLKLINCRFSENTALGSQTSDGTGGAVHVNTLGDTLVITNCLFHDNIAGFGGALWVRFVNVELTNGTFSKNHANVSGGAVFYESISSATSATVRNSIFWNNSATQTFPEITASQSLFDVQYCDVKGGWTGAGAGPTNLDEDPLFVDPDNSDFRLQCSSPCINRGLDASVPDDSDNVNEDAFTTEPTPDLDLKWRLVGVEDASNVDMGAYEVPPVMTCGGDIVPLPCRNGIVNVNDLLEVILRWGQCPSAPEPCYADVYTSGASNGVVDVNDLLTVINEWGACPGFSGGESSMPQSVSECMDVCSNDLEPYSEAWDACVSRCVQGLCEAQVISCD